MKWQKIVETYKDEWVLVEVIKIDSRMKIKEGKVLYHSKDKNEIYNKLIDLKPKKFSIEYTGKIPEELAVVLVSYEDL